MLTLHKGSLTCKIAPEMGGAIYSFSYEENGHRQPLLRDTPGPDSHLIVDWASWPLVPFSNRINKGRFSFGGKDYKIPVTWLGPPHHASHGHGWERPWSIVRQTETACDLTFALDDKAIWPFPYKAEQNFELTDKGLRLRLAMTNTGDQPMPAGLGIHPYFPKKPGTTLKAVVDHLWEIDQFTIPEKKVAVPAHYDFAEPKILDEAKLDHCFGGYGGEMEITWPGEPKTLRVTSSKNLGHFVVYTPKGENFFCAEPVSHMPDAVNRMAEPGNGLIVLQPGQTLEADYFFEVIDRPAARAAGPKTPQP